MDDYQIAVTLDDYMDGLRAISYVDSLELVDKNLKPTTLSAGERRTLISISLLTAFSPNVDRKAEAPRIKIDCEEMLFMNYVLEKFEKCYSRGENETCMELLGGLVAIIKADRLTELVKVSQSN